MVLIYGLNNLHNVPGGLDCTHIRQKYGYFLCTRMVKMNFFILFTLLVDNKAPNSTFMPYFLKNASATRLAAPGLNFIRKIRPQYFSHPSLMLRIYFHLLQQIFLTFFFGYDHKTAIKEVIFPLQKSQLINISP